MHPFRLRSRFVRATSSLVTLLAVAFIAGAVAVFPSAALADDVYLVNGQVFEDVVVDFSTSTDGEPTVKLRLEFGALTLPASHIDRIEARPSALTELLRREEFLNSSRSVDAARWLELSEWARSQDLVEGARRAALMAARLEPEMPELVAPMTRLGYRLDAQGVEWVSHDEAMRRQGLVESNGQWITVAQARAEAESARQQAAERRPRPAVAEPAPAAEQTNAADVALAQVELIRDMMGREVGVGISGGFAYGTYGVPALPLSGSFAVGPSQTRSISPSTQEAWDILSVRQPGSILPMQSYRQP